MIRALLVLLLLVSPALAAEDFTLRDSCKGHWGVFTDGLMASAEVDNCDGVAQDEDNDILWLLDNTVDDDNAPPMAPPGSDSVDNDITTSGGIFNSEEWGFDDITFVGWYETDTLPFTAILMVYGDDDNEPGSYSLRCQGVVNRLYGHVSDTFSDASLFTSCPVDTWMFLGMRYDGGDDTITVFTSLSQQSNTLVDCVDGCETEATGPSDHDKAILLNTGIDVGSAHYDGSQQEKAFFAEAMTDEEVCHLCRCGGLNDVRGVGRVDECNRCIVPDYQGCRRMID